MDCKFPDANNPMQIPREHTIAAKPSVSMEPGVTELKSDDMERLRVRIEEDKDIALGLDPDWFTIADDLDLPYNSVVHYGEEMWMLNLGPDDLFNFGRDSESPVAVKKVVTDAAG